MYIFLTFMSILTLALCKYLIFKLAFIVLILINLFIHFFNIIFLGQKLIPLDYEFPVFFPSPIEVKVKAENSALIDTAGP
jgi:hypothetical protein